MVGWIAHEIESAAGEVGVGMSAALPLGPIDNFVRATLRYRHVMATLSEDVREVGEWRACEEWNSPGVDFHGNPPSHPPPLRFSSRELLLLVRVVGWESVVFALTRVGFRVTHFCRTAIGYVRFSDF